MILLFSNLHQRLLLAGKRCFVIKAFCLALMSIGLMGTQVSYAQNAEEPKPSSDSPYAIEPQTPADIFQAVETMTDLGRFDLAREYLNQLLDQNLSDDELLEIRDQFGTVSLFRLARSRELNPQSQRFLDQVNAASVRQATDPARIDKILSDLDGTPRERELAILELRNIGVQSVPRIIQRLGNPQSDAERDRLVYILIKIGPVTSPALIAALETPNELLRVAVIEVLGFLGKTELADELWYYAFSDDQSPAVQVAARASLSRLVYGSDRKLSQLDPIGTKARLQKAAQSYFFGQRMWERDDQGNVNVWSWDPAQNTVQSQVVEANAANNFAAMRLARQALSFQTDDLKSQSLLLAIILADANQRNGWSQALPSGPGTAFSLALAAGVDQLNQAAELALQGHQIRTLESLINAIGQVGSHEDILSASSRQGILYRCLNHSNQRIQFAAAIAMLRANLQTPYRGSRRVVEILTRSLNDQGLSKVLVIDPNLDRGRSIGTVASRLGFELESANSGKQGFRIATERGDVALVLIHANSVDWELSQTLANLRADMRTADIPVAIFGPTFLENEYLITTNRDPLTTYIVFSDKQKEINRQITPFLDRIATPALTPDQRANRSAVAAYWLAQVVSWNRPDIYNLQDQAEVLYASSDDDRIAYDCLSVLATIQTKQAQTYIAELALGINRPEDIRTQAALELGYHVQKHGILIDDELVASLKELWKSADNADLQAALTVFVGSLQPSPAMTAKRLQSYDFPLTPAE